MNQNSRSLFQPIECAFTGIADAKPVLTFIIFFFRIWLIGELQWTWYLRWQIPSVLDNLSCLPLKAWGNFLKLFVNTHICVCFVFLITCRSDLHNLTPLPTHTRLQSHTCQMKVSHSVGLDLCALIPSIIQQTFWAQCVWDSMGLPFRASFISKYMHHLIMGEKSVWRHTHTVPASQSSPEWKQHGTGMVLNTEVNNQGEGALVLFLLSRLKMTSAFLGAWTFIHVLPLL